MSAKSDIIAMIPTLLADNNNGDTTPAIIRQVLTAMSDAMICYYQPRLAEKDFYRFCLAHDIPYEQCKILKRYPRDSKGEK